MVKVSINFFSAVTSTSQKSDTNLDFDLELSLTFNANNSNLLMNSGSSQGIAHVNAEP